MTGRRCGVWIVGFGVGSLAHAAQAQPTPAPLFASEVPLEVTLVADFETLRGDRNASPDRPGRVEVALGDGTRRAVAAELRTRGNFRLDQCAFPPLRLRVDVEDATGTPFEGQGALKLVSSCRPGRDSFEEMVVAEYLAYRTFHLFTDASFRVRALRLTLVDAEGRSEPETRFAFLIEEDDALADRMGATPFELEEGKNLPVAGFEPVALLITSIFQYMIGNPDWAAEAGHNVEIVQRGGAAVAVPYDFDFSGLVDAPYATPPPDLGIASVRERRYRGWCQSPFVTRLVLERFRASRDDVVRLWTEAEGLSEATRRRAVAYLGDFFDAIETDERADRRFLRDCRRG